jgi:hypothetical protein
MSRCWSAPSPSRPQPSPYTSQHETVPESPIKRAANSLLPPSEEAGACADPKWSSVPPRRRKARRAQHHIRPSVGARHVDETPSQSLSLLPWGASRPVKAGSDTITPTARSASEGCVCARSRLTRAGVGPAVFAADGDVPRRMQPPSTRIGGRTVPSARSKRGAASVRAKPGVTLTKQEATSPDTAPCMNSI